MGRLNRSIPDWIRFSIPGGSLYRKVGAVAARERLHTICIEARCPNVGECFSRGTATFLMLGDVCTRNCRYCAVRTGRPRAADASEPGRLARAVRELGLRYAVLTSVTRDDLPDGGAGLIAQAAGMIRSSADCAVELLVPDFRGAVDAAIETVAGARPAVINHNIEVVRRLYCGLRPLGDYQLSLAVLRRCAEFDIPVKSGLMVGFGETVDDIRTTLGDLYDAGCRMLTVGQYLQAQPENAPVEKYYHPEEFEHLAETARCMGFTQVQAGPLVRSSYRADLLAGDMCAR